MEREKQADKETAKQKEIIEFKAESAKAEDSEQEKSSQVITLLYCNYVLKRLWEDDLQLDQKIKELKKTRKELRFDLNSAAEYMCFCKAILPDSEEYGLIDRDSFLGNPVGNMYYDDFEQTFNFLEDNENKLIIWIKSVLGDRYNTASLLMPIKNKRRPNYMSRLDNDALTRLSTILLRLLQQKLTAHGCYYHISEIPECLRNAAVVLLNAEEGKKIDDIVLIAAKPQEIMMRVNGRLSRRKTIDDMLRAVGLEPLPASLTLSETSRRLKAGFRVLDDAISPLFFLKF